jgi:CheY-like chemotaxis protein
VGHDPAALKGDAGDVPDFRSLPELLRTVLVVDDNDEFRSFLVRLLSAQGLNVHQACDGEEALRLAFIERPWLIVTDTRMPRMDGFELCRRVRSHSLVGHTPVVFLSGWDDYANRYRALELGADEYISKSAPVRELLMRLHLLLARYATLGSATEGGRMRGGLDAVGAVGLIQMCHLTRLTGLLSLRSGTRLVEMRWREGEIVAAESDRGVGVPVLHEVLGWTRGFFDFTPCAIAESETLGPFTQLLLEGCRLLDERRRNAQGS